MNRDMLKSLIRTANGEFNDPDSNPANYENERNSAARMVCKILAEYSFPNEVSSEFDYKTWCQRHRKLKTNCGCK